GRDLEHLAGALAVAAGDDRRVDVEESLLLEEIVDRPADAVAQAGDGAEGVGPGPQMGDGPQELEGMALFLERISLMVGIAVDGDALGVQLGGLPLGGRFFHLADDGDAGAGAEFLDLALVVGQLAVGDDLQVTLAGAVVEFEEAEAALGIAAG